MKSICLFAGSSFGARSSYRQAAEELGRGLAERGITLVYGGASVGLMSAAADAALQAGGTVIGVIPEALVAKEVAHTGLTELKVVGSMHERKALMSELSDAFIALPGGLGTFEEFFEVLTWAQLGFHRKPCGLLNIDGYFDHLLAMIDHAVQEKLLRLENRRLIMTGKTLDSLLDQFQTYAPPVVQKWISQEESL